MYVYSEILLNLAGVVDHVISCFEFRTLKVWLSKLYFMGGELSVASPSLLTLPAISKAETISSAHIYIFLGASGADLYSHYVLHRGAAIA
jgi:hypothetical protein